MKEFSQITRMNGFWERIRRQAQGEQPTDGLADRLLGDVQSEPMPVLWSHRYPAIVEELEWEIFYPSFDHRQESRVHALANFKSCSVFNCFALSSSSDGIVTRRRNLRTEWRNIHATVLRERKERGL